MNCKEVDRKERKNTVAEIFAAEVVAKLPSINSYLAEKFEELQHDGFQAAQDVENEADVHIAREWVNFVQSRFPSFNIDTEEALGKIDVGGQYTVRVDSIDGSKHFRSGIPIFGSNISLTTNDKVLFGACIHPMLHETYYAVKQKGAYRNGRRISISSVNSIRNAFIVAEGPTSKLAGTNPLAFQSALETLDILKQEAFRVRDFGLGAFSLCLVANGACAGYVDLSGTTKTYDIESAGLILQEAGGVLYQRFNPQIETRSASDLSNSVIIASNKEIHNELLDCLKLSK